MVDQFYAAFDSEDMTAASKIAANISEELSPWETLKPIEINSLVWVRRKGGGKSIGLVRSIENGRAEVVLRGDGAVPENLFKLNNYTSQKLVRVDDLTRVNGEEVVSILQGRGSRSTLMNLKNTPVKVRVVRFEKSTSTVPKKAPIPKFAHLLEEEAIVTINGNRIAVPHAGQVEIGSNVIIDRADSNGLWRIKKDEKIWTASFGGNDYEFTIDVDGKPTQILFQPPLYTELTSAGVPIINLKTVQSDEFYRWKKTGLEVSNKEKLDLWDLGRKNKIMTYGVSDGMGEGGMRDLIAIAATEQIRPFNPEAPHFGHLIPLSPAGRNGTYFVILNSPNPKDYEFVLPTQSAVQWFEKGLTEAVQKGLMTLKERASILKRTFTFQGFVRSRNKSN